MIRTALLTSLPALMLLSSGAVQAGTREDETLWLNLTAMGPVKGDLVYFAEVQPRFRDGMGKTDQVILRGALGWKLSPGVTLYQGYGHIIVPMDGRQDVRESRSFQQLSWVIGTVAGGALSSRTRLEQRWRSDGGDMGWRLREMLRYARPLAKSGKGSKALVYSEAFVAFNSTDWGAKGGFDQIRNFIGLEIPVGGKSTVEAGYLNQYIDAAGPTNRMNHALSLTLFVRH